MIYLILTGKLFGQDKSNTVDSFISKEYGSKDPFQTPKIVYILFNEENEAHSQFTDALATFLRVSYMFN